MSRWIKFGLSLAITVGCMWWTLRHQFDLVDSVTWEACDAVRAGCEPVWRLTWASIRAANWLMVLPYLGILTVIHVARTLRWGNLLSGLEKVPFKPLNEASAIGFMMLIILPFRLGEFARPFLLAQRSGIRRSAGMTSVVFERVVDGVAIALLLRGLMFFMPADRPGMERIRIGANLMFLVFFSGLVFLLLARWKHDLVIGLMRKTVGRLAPGLTEKVVHIVDGFVGALKQLPDARNMTLFFVWTAIYWLANGWGMSLFANAFDCSGAAGAACHPLHISVFEGFVVLCVLIVGMMIPAAPGAAGTAQWAMLLALGVFVPAAVVNSSGVAYANVLWAVQMLQQIAFGLFFMIRSHLSFREIAGKLGDEQEGAT